MLMGVREKGRELSLDRDSQLTDNFIHNFVGSLQKVQGLVGLREYILF